MKQSQRSSACPESAPVLLPRARNGRSWHSRGRFCWPLFQPAAAQVDDSYHPPAGGGGGGGSFDDQIRRQGGVPPPASSARAGTAAPVATRGPAGGAGAQGGGGGEGLRGTQRQGVVAPIPIAIPAFLGDDPKLSADISRVIASDLERSGLFQPLDPASYLEDIRDVNALPRFPDWRQISADALAVGRVVRAGDGRLTAEFRLWDVTSGKQLAGQRFSTSGQNWRRVGHMVADQIYERLTGEKGYFDTRVVFVDETGPRPSASSAWPSWIRTAPTCGF